MSRERELDLYLAWDKELTALFSAASATSQLEETQPSVDDSTLSAAYRKRIGQDLQSFEQKLSSIMERDKRGQ